MKTSVKKKRIVTDRDRQIIAAVNLLRAATSHQIAMLFYNGPSSRCRDRLEFLHTNGYLKQIELPMYLSAGSKPYVYVTGRLHAKHLFLAHILDISEVYVNFKRATLTSGFSLDEWLPDAELKKSKDFIIPDASFMVNTPEKPYRFLAEVDKGTEVLKDIAQKFINYRTYFQPDNGPSLYEQRYHTDRGRVLCIAPTLQRLLNMKSVCEQQGGRTRYWFTTMEELKTQNVLYAPIWRRAGSDEVFCLI